LLHTRLLLTEVKASNGETMAAVKVVRRGLAVFEEYATGKILAETSVEPGVAVAADPTAPKEAAAAKKGAGKDVASQSAREDYEA
jgi:hypothetical protein